jgi:hypothetical protein
MHSSCWKLTLSVWICPRDVRIRSSEECTVYRRAPSLPQAREENARSPSMRPTLALKPNGALPRAIAISIFSNDPKKAVLFVGDASREKDTLTEWQKIP